MNKRQQCVPDHEIQTLMAPPAPLQEEIKLAAEATELMAFNFSRVAHITCDQRGYEDNHAYADIAQLQQHIADHSTRSGGRRVQPRSQKTKKGNSSPNFQEDSAGSRSKGTNRQNQPRRNPPRDVKEEHST